MNLHKLLYFFVPLLIWSCANRVPPSGGPKDKDPPKLIGSIPKDGSINVKGKEISLLFDEQVVVKNITKELLITPRIDFDYTYKTKKNTIIISLEEELDTATTYTFNFRDGIVDITEGNPAQDLILAFSTGPVLDTLQITGMVQDLFTEKPVKDVIVGLYNASDTLDLFNSPPYYLSQTNKKGQFIFRNLKSDDYKIYAFVDKNKNLMCQSDREMYAFQDSIIALDSNKIIKPLKLQYMNMDTLVLKRTRTSGQYYLAVANKALIDVSLTASNDSTLWYALDKEQKEIKIYNTFSIKDSLLVNLTLTDSLYQTVVDSFYLSFPESQRPYDKYETNLVDLQVRPEEKSIKYTITTNKPSRIEYPDSIVLTLDTLAVANFDSTWNIQANSTQTEFKLSNYLPKNYLDSLGYTSKSSSARTVTQESKMPESGQRKRNLTYKLVIPKATVLSIESDSSSTMEAKLSPAYAKNFGELKGTIQTKYSNYRIQLLDKSYNVLDETSEGSTYIFRYISPGDYLIRIIIDANENGRWDPGNIYLNQLPEPIFIYKDEEGKSKTTIRANWELTLDLTF